MGTTKMYHERRILSIRQKYVQDVIILNPILSIDRSNYAEN